MERGTYVGIFGIKDFYTIKLKDGKLYYIDGRKTGNKKF